MTKKVDFDIESLDPYQKDLVIGFRKGEMTIMMAGRQVGKSTFSSQAFQRLWDDIYNAERPVTDLILEEGKVYGARYYTIEPVGGNWHHMEQWCIQTFGDAAEVWDLKETTYIWPEMGRWYVNSRRFWFRDIKDRDWFVLKWNS